MGIWDCGWGFGIVDGRFWMGIGDFWILGADSGSWMENQDSEWGFGILGGGFGIVNGGF